MDIIEGKNFSKERALYNLKDTTVKNCTFKGEEDGESALKECRNIAVENCEMHLRYPLWHDIDVTLKNCTQSESCRAALWYDENLNIDSCSLGGIKCVRECKNVKIENSHIESSEFGWKNDNVEIKNCKLTAEYAFLESKNINIEKLDFSGKYSFQYCNNIKIKDSVLNTKDAFWHTKDAVIENCLVNGEYLGWYSENLTFINCKITGTQPLCYCKNLRLINCTMENCDLSFEYSDVNAEILGNIPSVKNVISGKVVADSYGEIIKEDSIYPLNCNIIKR